MNFVKGFIEVFDGKALGNMVGVVVMLCILAVMITFIAVVISKILR